MKKTFVALAALAAVGAASAQVSLTGAYTFGYEQSGITGNGGLYTDGAAIKLTAVEDLGNGMSATAVVSAGGLVRSSTAGNVGGEDASLTFAGGFGSVELASKETGDATSSAWLAPGYGLDYNGTFSGGTPKDRITYKAPAMGGLSLSASYTDRSSGADAVGAGGTKGALAGNTRQPYTGLSASYAMGNLTLGAGYTFANRTDVASPYKADYTLSGKYNAGVVVVAAAYNKDSRYSDGKYAVGVSVPMGAVTLGAQTGQTTASVQVTSVGAKYDLSKSVNVTGSYIKQENGPSSARVLVSKSF